MRFRNFIISSCLFVTTSFVTAATGDFAADRVLGQLSVNEAVITQSTTATNFRRPSGVAVTFDGHILASDRSANRVVKFQHPWGDRYSVSPWRVQHFTPDELRDPAICGHHADPDGDGQKNAIEYALGSNPRQVDAPASELHLIPSFNAATGGFTFSFPMKSSFNDITYWTQWSDDLKNWQLGIGFRNFESGNERRDEFHDLGTGLLPTEQILGLDASALTLESFFRRQVTTRLASRPHRFARLFFHGGP